MKDFINEKKIIREISCDRFNNNLNIKVLGLLNIISQSPKKEANDNQISEIINPIKNHKEEKLSQSKISDNISKPSNIINNLESPIKNHPDIKFTLKKKNKKIIDQNQIFVNYNISPSKLNSSCESILLKGSIKLNNKNKLKIIKSEGEHSCIDENETKNNKLIKNNQSFDETIINENCISKMSQSDLCSDKDLLKHSTKNLHNINNNNSIMEDMEHIQKVTNNEEKKFRKNSEKIKTKSINEINEDKHNLIPFRKRKWNANQSKKQKENEFQAYNDGNVRNKILNSSLKNNQNNIKTLINKNQLSFNNKSQNINLINISKIQQSISSDKVESGECSNTLNQNKFKDTPISNLNNRDTENLNYLKSKPIANEENKKQSYNLLNHQDLKKIKVKDKLLNDSVQDGLKNPSQEKKKSRISDPKIKINDKENLSHNITSQVDSKNKFHNIKSIDKSSYDQRANIIDNENSSKQNKTRDKILIDHKSKLAEKVNNSDLQLNVINNENNKDVDNSQQQFINKESLISDQSIKFKDKESSNLKECKIKISKIKNMEDHSKTKSSYRNTYKEKSNLKEIRNIQNTKGKANNNKINSKALNCLIDSKSDLKMFTNKDDSDLEKNSKNRSASVAIKSDIKLNLYEKYNLDSKIDKNLPKPEENNVSKEIPSETPKEVKNSLIFSFEDKSILNTNNEDKLLNKKNNKDKKLIRLDIPIIEGNKENQGLNIENENSKFIVKSTSMKLKKEKERLVGSPINDSPKLKRIRTNSTENLTKDYKIKKNGSTEHLKISNSKKSENLINSKYKKIENLDSILKKENKIDKNDSSENLQSKEENIQISGRKYDPSFQKNSKSKSKEYINNEETSSKIFNNVYIKKKSSKENTINKKNLVNLNKNSQSKIKISDNKDVIKTNLGKVNEFGKKFIHSNKNYKDNRNNIYITTDILSFEDLIKISSRFSNLEDVVQFSNCYSTLEKIKINDLNDNPFKLLNEIFMYQDSNGDVIKISKNISDVNETLKEDEKDKALIETYIQKDVIFMNSQVIKQDIKVEEIKYDINQKIISKIPSSGSNKILSKIEKSTKNNKKELYVFEEKPAEITDKLEGCDEIKNKILTFNSFKNITIDSNKHIESKNLVITASENTKNTEQEKVNVLSLNKNKEKFINIQQKFNNSFENKNTHVDDEISIKMKNLFICSIDNKEDMSSNSNKIKLNENSVNKNIEVDSKTDNFILINRDPNVYKNIKFHRQRDAESNKPIIINNEIQYITLNDSFYLNDEYHKIKETSTNSQNYDLDNTITYFDIINKKFEFEIYQKKKNESNHNLNDLQKKSEIIKTNYNQEEIIEINNSIKIYQKNEFLNENKQINGNSTVRNNNVFQSNISHNLINKSNSKILIKILVKIVDNSETLTFSDKTIKSDKNSYHKDSNKVKTDIELVELFNDLEEEDDGI